MLKKLGPGLMYAGAAIGVSHLVQSTRAGAEFGFSLWWVIPLCHMIKFPFFKIGAMYHNYSGKNLLEGYREIGAWAISLFILITVLTMFIIQAAVTIVTAGLFINLFSLKMSAVSIAILLILISFALLISNKFLVLEKFVKWMVILLSVTTIFCGLLSLKTFSFDTDIFQFNFSNKANMFFLVAFIGWMPAPLDVPIWQSIWGMEKMKLDKKLRQDWNEKIDFYVGYIGTAVMAFVFLCLGALIMNKTNNEFSPSAVGFSKQLIDMYVHSFGNWSLPFVATACFCTMFSTTLTCLDAFPRVLTEATKQIKLNRNNKDLYRVALVFHCLGSSLILIFFLQSMKQFVDFATTISFLITPVLASLSYLLFKKIYHKKSELVSSNFIKYTLLCVIILYGLSFYFIYLRL